MSDIRPEYKTPEVVTYRDSEILKQMGPIKGVTPIGAPQDVLGTSTEDNASGKRAIRDRSLFDRDE